MRVLMVVYCYPPMMVPASICYAKLVHGLVRNGVEVELAYIDPATFDSPGTPGDPGFAAVLPTGLTHHVIRSPEKTFWVKVANRLDENHRFTYRWLEPRKREWTFPALRELGKIDLSRFDALLTCSQPHANHLIGLELRRRTGLPWVAYFSDPWSGNPYTLFRSEAIRAYQRELESSVVQAADLVLFTCEEMRRFAMQEQPAISEERSGVLAHAFVQDWYEPPTAPVNAVAGQAVRVLHTGSFYGPRTPLPLIESLERIGGRSRLEGRLRIEHYGAMDDVHRDLIRAKGLEGVISLHGFVPYLQTLSMMAQSDALLLVDAPLQSASESVFLPSKLIDYLGARKPVIAVTPSSGATARVTREIGGRVCPLEEPEALDRELEAALERGRFEVALDEDQIVRYDHVVIGDSLARDLASASDERR